MGFDWVLLSWLECQKAEIDSVFGDGFFFN